MAPHSSTVARKTAWMEEPGGLQSMGSLRVRHDWLTSLSLSTFMHWRRKWQPNPVFLPGESHGQRSLVGCSPWGRTESDTTEATWQQEGEYSEFFSKYPILALLNVYQVYMELHFQGISHSVVSDSLWPNRPQPNRLLCSWDCLGKNTRVSCHFLCQGIFWLRDWSCISSVSCINRQILYHWASWKAQAIGILATESTAQLDRLGTMS